MQPSTLLGAVLRRGWAVLARRRGPRARPLPGDLLRGAVRASPLAGTAVGRALDQGLLRQATPTTCGSASLLLARLLVDADRAAQVLGGDRPLERFAAAEQMVKRRTNGLRRPGGRPRLPWPRSLGTPPWGAAAEMTCVYRLDGTVFAVRPVDSDCAADRLAAFDAVSACVRAGLAAPVYVGNGLSPRHVVLAVAVTSGALEVYDPATGGLVRIDRHAFATGQLALSGWNRIWAVVVPVSRRRPAPARPSAAAAPRRPR